VLGERPEPGEPGPLAGRHGHPVGDADLAERRPPDRALDMDMEMRFGK
jgi:hypothetical protein